MTTRNKTALNSETDRLLRRPEVEAMTSMSTSRLYAAMRDDRFPRPRRIGHGQNGAVAWLLSDVKEWMANLPVAEPPQSGRP